MFRRCFLLFAFSAIIPCYVSAHTFGETSILANTGNIANILVASRYQLSKAGTVQSITVYAATSGNIKVGIYRDNLGAPSSLVVQSAGTAVSAGWNTIDIADQSLSSGYYWLAMLLDTANVLKYAAGLTKQRAHVTRTYADGLPSSFGTPTYAAYKYSIYATYFIPDSITLNETTNSLLDRRVIAYDENAEGAIQLTGTYCYNDCASNPTHIEAKVFRRDTSAVVQINGNDWNTLSSESISGGNWSGTLTGIPKTNAWLGFSVRLSDSTSTTATGTHKIGVGYVVAYTGQSYIGYWTLYGPYTPADTETSSDLCSKFRHTSASRPACDADAHSVTVPFSGWQLNTGDGSIIFANQLQTELQCPIGVLDYGMGGAAILEANKSGSYGYWLGASGSTNWLEYIQAAFLVSEPMSRRKANAFIWYHGYTDCIAGEGYQDYYDAMESLFSSFRTAVNWASCPIFVVAQPRAANGTTYDQSFTDVRMAQYDIAMDDNESTIIFAGQAVDLPLYTDNVHLSEAAQEAEALRYAQSVLWHELGTGDYTYHRGPHNAGWTISDSTHTYVYLSHDGGSDFTPTSSIDSYQVYIGSSWVSATGERTAANKITLTHSSGTVTNVRCLWGRAPAITHVVKDDSALTLPVEALGDFSSINMSGMAQIY